MEKNPAPDPRELIAIIEECLHAQKEPSDGTVWIQARYADYMKRADIRKKKDADEKIYRSMYGTDPAGTNDVLKIRYWRTGHHLPADREEAIRFAHALGLDGADIRYMICGFMDRADRVFSEKDREDPVYLVRRACMDELKQDYMKQIPPELFGPVCKKRESIEKNLRHLYFVDSLRLIEREALTGHSMAHIESASFGSELGRIFSLYGEIRRSTMIRHLILLSMPFLTVSRLDSLLERLGYRKLSEEHSTLHSGRLDLFVIRLLTLYERECTGRSATACLEWLREAFRFLDHDLSSRGESGLRLMYFKSLGKVLREKERSSILTGLWDFKSLTEGSSDELEWCRDMLFLREKYADTPPGIRTEAQREQALQELNRKKEEHLLRVTNRITSGYEPEEEPFVGRQKLLEKTAAALHSDVHRVILYGEGGIGKSSIARRYALEHFREYDQILFLTYSGSIESTICDDNMCAISGIRYDAEQHGSRRRYFTEKMRILKRIAAEQHLLLILDNCDVMEDRNLERILALPCEILITTRVNPVSWHLPDGLLVEGLQTRSEWEAFVRCYASSDPDQQMVEKIERFYQKTNGHTLSMKLFLQNEEENGEEERENFIESLLKRPLISKKEQEALRVLAIMPVEGIPSALFYDIAEVTEKTMRRLISCSLVQMRTDPVWKDALFSMHPVIRDAMLKLYPVRIRSYKKMIHRLAAIFYNAWEEDYRTNSRRVIYARTVLRAFPDPPAWLADELDTLVTLVWIQGYFDEAIEYSLKIYHACETSYGKYHQVTGRLALRTGAVYHNATDNLTAYEWFRRAYDILDHCTPDVGFELDYMLACERMSQLSQIGQDYEKALRYNQRGLDTEVIYRRKYPKGYHGRPNVAYMMRAYFLLDRGRIFLAMDRIGDAEYFAKEALEEIRRIVNGGFRLVEFYLLIIRLYMRDREQDKAQTLAREVVEACTRYRGTTYKETLKGIELLGDVCAMTQEGKTDAAECYRHVLGMLKRYYPQQKNWISQVRTKCESIQTAGS